MKGWIKRKTDILSIKTNFKGLFLIPIMILLFGVQTLEGGTYTDSAHGNSSYGVDRTSTDMYTKGHCAHCHEQHASIDGKEPEPAGGPDHWLIYATLYTDQNTVFCLHCHDAPGNSKQQSMPDQYSYSYKFGGYTDFACPSNIRQAFSFITESGVPQSVCGSTTGSAHQLTDIRDFLKGKWGFGTTDAEVNPCSGCHNPHKAQRHYYPGSMGTSPISLPTSHDSDWNVYGAETTERMKNNHIYYQAPYYYGSTTTYEPEGNGTSDGSNMPDYVAFCTTCHDISYSGVQMPSSQKFQLTNDPWIQNPDWSASPHGTNGAQSDATNRKAPYTDDTKNYVLSCTDCHEPHGSSNLMLIRKEVNGESSVTFTNWDDRSHWLTLCQRCHTIASSHYENGSPCYSCHTHDPSCSDPF